MDFGSGPSMGDSFVNIWYIKDAYISVFGAINNCFGANNNCVRSCIYVLENCYQNTLNSKCTGILQPI